MSILRLGRNPDGTRQTIDLGPQRGHLTGHRFVPLSEALTLITMVKGPKPKPKIIVKNVLERPTCGVRLTVNQHARLDEGCARNPGHKDHHRSRWALDTARDQRRAERP